MKLKRNGLLSFFTLVIFYALCVATTVNDPDKMSAEKSGSEVNEWAINKGRCNFLQYCKPCHVSIEENKIDNPLNGLFKRLPEPADRYFVRFISDSKLLRDNGDDYAIAVHQSWESNYNHKFKSVFSADEFAELIAYIKHQ